MRTPLAASLKSQVQTLVVGTVALFGLLAGVSILVSQQADRAGEELREVIRPSQLAVSDYRQGFVDQLSGFRGYLLTGEDSFLRPYQQGQRTSDRTRSELETLLVGHPEAIRLLDATQQAGTAWRTSTSDVIAERRDGPLPQAAARSAVVEGEQQFAELRDQLIQLDRQVDRLAERQIESVTGTQAWAHRISLAALAVAVLGAVLAWWHLRARVLRPLDRLVHQVGEVSGGDFDARIDADGPAEIASVAQGVDRMRNQLLDSGRRLSQVERELSAREEQDRIARDLHASTIHRVFGVGLQLESIASRYPQVSGPVHEVVRETDGIIAEIRDVVYRDDRDVAYPDDRDAVYPDDRDVAADEPGPLPPGE